MDAPSTILVVDDQDSSREVLARFLGELGYTTLAAADVPAALTLLHGHNVDLVITDLRMPRIDGLECLRRIKTLDADLCVIMVTAYASVDTAVAAMKAGAFDYVKKPIEFEELELVVARALRHRGLVRENRELRAQVESRFRVDNIIGKGRAMAAVFELIRKVAPAEVPVLITGESGTGKDLVARAVHGLSRRAHRTFFSVNCAAVPESLLESELFGHVKGAFSGAERARVGYFREADGGTLFLDEIGDMSLAQQAKLLRVLESGELIPVGSEQPVRVDVRLVTATNCNLEELTTGRRFRSDLLFRIDAVRIELPPLRERREDIPLLIEHFLHKAGNRGLRLSRSAMQKIFDYSWPGNVRELENAIERALLVASGDEVQPSDLPARVRGGSGFGNAQADDVARAEKPFRQARQSFEHAYFAALLERADGNITTAAKLAGLHRATLHAKLKLLGLVAPD